MAATKRTPRMTRPKTGDTVERLAAEAGSAPKEIDGVSRLSSGYYKMVGFPHDAKIGMVIPRAIADAWAREAREQGLSKTDLFEDMMLRYLKTRGWKLG